MNTNDYVNSLQPRINDLLARIYPIADYYNRIACKVIIKPNASSILVDFNILSIVPRSQPSALTWGLEVYKRLRHLPASEQIVVKFNHPKSRWNAIQLDQDALWTDLELCGGLFAYISASINSPAPISGDVMVTLDWTYHAPGGTY